MMPQLKNTMAEQRGFSLLEAIVAFLVVSIGMLGIASLQMLSLKAGYTARVHTMVVIKAEEMFERIRNNPIALDPTNAASASYESDIVDSGVNNGCNDSSGTAVLCTYAEIARDDIYNWKADLRNSLYFGDNNTTASIVVVPRSAANPTATVNITIYWQERDPESQAMNDFNSTFSTYICDNTQC